MTPVFKLGVAIAPEAIDSTGSTETAVAPFSQGCCQRLSFPPSAMNEEDETNADHLTVFDTLKNIGTAQAIAHGQFQSLHTVSPQVCLN